MVSGLALILIGLALVAGVGLTLVWERYRSRALLLQSALDALPIAAQIVLDGRRVVYANAACRAQFEDAVTPLPELLRRRAFDEAAGAALQRLTRVPAGGRAELALAGVPGEPGWWEVIARPVANPPRYVPGATRSAKPSGHILWLCRDITAERRAEAALRPLVQALEGPADAIGALASGALPSQADSRRFEAQLAQTLRLKAVGQLAGGIAHDFNNLLTVMIGFSDLLLLRHPPGDPSFADIMQIRKNAERAANLVRQLLAYSGRQTLQPRIVSLADVLAELAPLLRRLIGRHVELKLEQGTNLDPVLVDPGQLEQVITNLVVNARDAMPAGGIVTIRTGNLKLLAPLPAASEGVPPGDYVQIDVIDTGTGIAPDIIDRIFEPFFTTKRVGAGTGLGLAMVYGIVKQSGGYLSLDSTVGVGSAFRIYLPRHLEKATSLARREVEEDSRDLTGSGTVMLVEDEEAVRMFSARALRNKGYKVIEASSGRAALDLMGRSADPIDLLITDVVMPEIDGPALVEEFRAARPGLKVIFISGYAESSFRNSTDGASLHFLAKPFSLKQLAAKVKDVLVEGG
jgi:two-component system cell cycle sensor histidine kinase/response regulator CckA